MAGFHAMPQVRLMCAVKLPRGAARLLKRQPLNRQPNRCPAVAVSHVQLANPVVRPRADHLVAVAPASSGWSERVATCPATVVSASADVPHGNGSGWALIGPASPRWLRCYFIASGPSAGLYFPPLALDLLPCSSRTIQSPKNASTWLACTAITPNKRAWTVRSAQQGRFMKPA